MIQIKSYDHHERDCHYQEACAHQALYCPWMLPAITAAATAATAEKQDL